MSSLLFQTYEQEIVALLANLKQRKLDARYMDQLNEVETLVRQLDLESRNASSDNNTTKSRVLKLKEEVKSLRAKVEKDMLLLDHHNNNNLRVVENFDEEDMTVLDRTSETLLGATRTLYETEAVASGIGEDLLMQRATILSAKEKVSTFSSLLSSAQRSMRSMQNEEVRQRVIAYAAVAFSLLLLCIYVITALSKHIGSSGDATPAPSLD